jgi:VIT family
MIFHRIRALVKPYLESSEIFTEVLFGLIMVLTFTLGAGLIVKEGHEATTKMLWGIIGCNVAWGIIDGVMYVMNSMFERSRKARLLQAIQGATNEADSLAIIGKALDDRLAPITSPAERKNLYREVRKRLATVIPERTRVQKSDIYGAIANFCLVLISAIPAVLPFLLIDDRFLALRVSNVLLLTMLFLVGYRWAQATNSNPWVTGSTFAAVGLILVGIAIPLGG